MKISYDPKVDAMNIRFKSGKYDHTKKITDEILVDLTNDGKVLGLEILTPKNNLGKSSRKRLNFLQNPPSKALIQLEPIDQPNEILKQISNEEKYESKTI